MAQIVKFNDLEFDVLVSIEQEIIDVVDRPEVTNKYRKLLFFALREGIFRTFHKIKSKTNQQLNVEKRYTVITVKHSGSLYTNFSTQTSANKEEFVISNNFFAASIAPKITDILSNQSFNQFVRDEQDQIGLTLPQKANPSVTKDVKSKKGVFLYGLGDYSRVYIAQNIKSLSKAFCIDYSYQLAKYYCDTFGYKNFGIIPEDSYPLLPTIEKPLAIIATYHSDHTRIAKEIFDINPRTLIFIEKPPCVTLQDIKTLIALYNDNASIEIGYNRRFIPINHEIRSAIFKQQKVINISVKEILLNESHWYFWKNQGTRITGNLTHWIDLAVYWINGSPIEINLLSSPSKDETIAVSILFSEGSLVNITVSDKGNSLRGVQEQIEIRTECETFFIEDYLKYTRVKSDGSKTVKRKLKRIKGHDAMYKHLTKVYNNEEPISYTKEDLIKSAVITYHVSRMYRENVRNFKMVDILDQFN